MSCPPDGPGGQYAGINTISAVRSFKHINCVGRQLTVNVNHSTVYRPADGLVFGPEFGPDFRPPIVLWALLCAGNQNTVSAVLQPRRDRGKAFICLETVSRPRRRDQTEATSLMTANQILLVKIKFQQSAATSVSENMISAARDLQHKTTQKHSMLICTVIRFAYREAVCHKTINYNYTIQWCTG